jgi:hypothetical protein
METSTSIAKIAPALAAFQKEIKPIKKDGINPHFHSRYATLDAIMDAIRPVMAKHDLAIVQSQNATRLIHTSGEWIEVVVDLAPASGTPQAYGSAMTYARRYGVSAILGLATEDDDDATAAQPPAPAPAPAKPVTPRPVIASDAIKCPECWATKTSRGFAHRPDCSLRGT